MIERILKNGIYYLQSDKRKTGYFTEDSEGNLINHEYKVTLREKLEYLLFGKEPSNPISTSYLTFIQMGKGKLIVYSGSVSTDAISLAKDVKKSWSWKTKRGLEILENSVRIDYGDRYQEMTFDEYGNNIESIVVKKGTNEVLAIRKFSFLNWENL